MKMIKYIGFIVLVISPLIVTAQKQVSPIPIVEKEIRNGTSQKMRSADLERIKTDGLKKGANGNQTAVTFKFAEIKKDFESIQKLQDSIIKAYTKSKKINYQKIAKNAKSMTLQARRLDKNIFGKKPTGFSDTKPLAKSKKSLRNLIIELDKSIGNFVTNPLFKDFKTVDTAVSKKAQTDLEQIIILSQKLTRAAEKNR